MPWWASPAGINFGFLLPVLLLIAWLGESSMSGLTIRGIRFLDSYYMGVATLVLLTSGLSGWMGSFIQAGQPQLDTHDHWEAAAVTVGVVALGAYCIWFRDFILDPFLLLETLEGQYRPDRTNIELTTGITSLANVAPLFFSIYSYKIIAKRVPMARVSHLLCALLVVFTLFRVYAWSERLAMIEALVPFGLALSVYWGRARTLLARVLMRLGPFFALPMLVLYFAAFEHARAWQADTYNKNLSFWEFALGRLASYYYTSLNNGAGMLATNTWPTYQFEYTLSWLHKAPLIGSYFSHLVDLNYEQLTAFLDRFGDVEFNNPSGVYAVLYDLGVPLGLVYFILVGFVGGATFRAYRLGVFAGVLLYPMFFITFLEVFRYPYLGTSRAFTWLLGITLALLINVGMTRASRLRANPLDSSRFDATT